MKKRNRIVFHRGYKYSIFADKCGTFTLLPVNVFHMKGLKEAAEKYGHSYMYNTHPAFTSLEDCKAYIDKNFPE